MKYKNQIITGALALSILMSGGTIYASSVGNGVKNEYKTFQKTDKGEKNKVEKGKGNIVGKVSALTNTGFTLEVINMKTKVATSVDVKTDTMTVYKKDGVLAKVTDLSVGEKVIVSGVYDKTASSIAAKVVKIVTKPIVKANSKKIGKVGMLNKAD